MSPNAPLILTHYHQGPDGVLAELRLNRPQALNAFNQSMCESIHTHLNASILNPDIKGIVISGTGERAFCAGGDVRALYQACLTDPDTAHTLLRTEYQLIHQMAHCPKPLISFCQGLTLGGGVGTMIHARWRVCAPNCQWGMPEARIGFFPDVGTNYALPHYLDVLTPLFLLSGDRLNAGDLYHFGIVHAVVDYEQFDPLIQALAQTDWHQTAIESILQQAHTPCSVGPWVTQRSKLLKHSQNLELETLQHALNTDPDLWIQSLGHALSIHSPTSLALISALYQNHRPTSLAHCLNIELDLACFCLHHPDFKEGVRARLIDKDHQPQWKPGHFSALNWEDLRHITFQAQHAHTLKL